MADHHPAPSRPAPDAPEKLARTIVFLATAGAVAFVALVLIFVF